MFVGVLERRSKFKTFFLVNKHWKILYHDYNEDKTVLHQSICIIGLKCNRPNVTFVRILLLVWWNFQRTEYVEKMKQIHITAPFTLTGYYLALYPRGISVKIENNVVLTKQNKDTFFAFISSRLTLRRRKKNHLSKNLWERVYSIKKKKLNKPWIKI